jgi:hypothetical protein
VAVERLERRLAVVRLAAKPASDLPEFAGFQAPAITQPGTLPLAAERRVPTQPLGIAEVEYEGPAPLLDRLKRNFADLTGGHLDLANLKDRSQEMLERLPVEALKQKLPEALKKLPLKRLFGDKGT